MQMQWGGEWQERMWYEHADGATQLTSRGATLIRLRYAHWDTA